MAQGREARKPKKDRARLVRDAQIRVLRNILEPFTRSRNGNKKNRTLRVSNAWKRQEEKAGMEGGKGPSSKKRLGSLKILRFSKEKNGDPYAKRCNEMTKQ